MCVLTAACLVSANASAQRVRRGPYLQIGAPTSMTVVWRTDVATTGKVEYGTAVGSLSLSATDNKTHTQHEVRLTGLQPGTRYYYRVGTATAALAGGDAQHFFDTSPATGSATRFRLWVVGDSGTGGSMQKKVRDTMLTYVGADRPNLYLHMGDMAYSDGKDAEFQTNFFDIYQNILRNTVCWPTMGNHEGHNANSNTQTGPYYDAYALPKAAEAGGLPSGTEAYYSFDHANVHFVVLNSYDISRKVADPMLTWLKSDLASTKQPWIVAFFHHPPYTKGSHDSDTEGNLVDMRENALPILEAGGVDLVLAGHSHVYERSWLLSGAYATPSRYDASLIVDKGDGKLKGTGAYRKPATAGKGAVYVVAGHGGTGVSSKGKHPLMYFTEVQNGSCVVDVNGNTLTLVNVRHDGQLTDNFTIVKGSGPVAADGGVPPQRDGGGPAREAGGPIGDGAPIAGDGGIPPQRDGSGPLTDGATPAGDGASVGAGDGGGKAEGCSCQTASRPVPSTGYLLLALAALGLARSARRRRARAPSLRR